MKNARQVFDDFATLSLRDTAKAADMFTENGAFEMPYLESLGFEWRFEGREKIKGFFDFCPRPLSRLRFPRCKSRL